jgi:hypothetical protein
MVSSKKFVATQKTSMSGGPIVGDIFVVLAQLVEIVAALDHTCSATSCGWRASARRIA